MPTKLQNILKSRRQATAAYRRSPWSLNLLRKYLGVLGLALSFLLIPAGSTLLSPVATYAAIPTIQIISVTTDQEVTVRTYDFPANQTFSVTMGPMGTRGIGGMVVGTINSGAGGTFDATFPIPAALHGSNQISIRLQTSHLYPYYSYNWFFNKTTSSGGSGQGGQQPPPAPAYTGIPTFKIVSVSKNNMVTIETNNYPANQTFQVLMGAYGMRGIGGVAAGSFNSGTGGTQTQQITIPAALHNMDRIAIRTQTAHTNPYYSYNWFWNTDGNVPAPNPNPNPNPNPGQGGIPSSAIPTIAITKVVKDVEVTFQTTNYPANQTFAVYMGPAGSQGIGGTWVGQFSSGQGGSFSVTVPIPAALHATSQISIRAQTNHLYPYFSYNWFYNTTTP
jgi:hypothetical protein